MKGEERRKRILQILTDSGLPVSGAALAKQLQVSRQVIVQDVALLRANGNGILSTNRGYMLQEKRAVSRIFKVLHSDEGTEDELTLIVDLGGKIQDVFVYHKAYGIVRAEMNIQSRKDIQEFMENISSGKSSLLKNMTAGYHYHTVLARDKKTMDLIQKKLGEKGLLAQLKDYEPVDFRHQAQQ